jgi:pilus assembly protein Flp/PilA
MFTKRKSKGQSLAEYGLILALIAVVCIGALTTLGQNLDGQLRNLAGQISTGMSTAPSGGGAATP